MRHRQLRHECRLADLQYESPSSVRALDGNNRGFDGVGGASRCSSVDQFDRSGVYRNHLCTAGEPGSLDEGSWQSLPPRDRIA